jgi:hypothetical protein
MPLEPEQENLVLNTLIRHEKRIAQQTELITELQKNILELIDILRDDAHVRAKS